MLLLEPPFLELRRARDTIPGVGSILVVDLDEGIPALAEAVELRRRAPWCPLVARISDRRITTRELATFESVPGTSAPLYPGDFVGHSEVSRALASVARRPRPCFTTIALWLEYRLRRHGIAGTLVACFGEESDVAQPPRTLTRRVRELGPLEVRDWRGLARLAQLAVTPRPWTGGGLESVAYAAEIDPRTLRRWLRLATDLGWSEFSQRSGWEWVLESALRLAGYVERRVERRVSGSVERVE